MARSLTFVSLFLLLPLSLLAGTLDQDLRSNKASVRRTALVAVLDKSLTADIGVAKSVLRGPLYDDDSSVRQAAIAVLVHRKVADFNKDLIVLLRTGADSVRESAAHALGKLGNKETVTLVLWKSLGDKIPAVRRQAVTSIDLLHGTKLGFYWDQDPKEYRKKAQEALRDFLTIDKKENTRHKTK